MREVSVRKLGIETDATLAALLEGTIVAIRDIGESQYLGYTAVRCTVVQLYSSIGYEVYSRTVVS